MWKIKIHKLVVDEDFKKINQKDKEVIIKTIYKKLSIGPKEYEVPLKYQLKDYWKLRVNDFRVIYRIENEEIIVYVVKIGMRKDETVYKEMITRIDKL